MFDNLDPIWQVQRGSNETTLEAELGPVELEIRFPPILENKLADVLEAGALFADDGKDVYEAIGAEAREIAEVLRE